jgi:hypothetical protein
LTSLAYGQQPVVLQYRSDAPDAKVKLYGGVAKAAVRAGNYAAEKPRIDEYFDKFYFPDMTGTAPEELGRLGDSRYKLFKDYLWESTSPEFQQTLTNKAFTAMINILKAQDPPYHPAVRFNAVLVIGMLDRQYGVEGSRPSEPLPQATKALVAIVDTATVNDRFSPAVILGAVIGLERHAQLRQSVAADDVARMTTSLLKLINHDTPIQDMDPVAYAWLQLRSASALSRLGTVGTNNAFHNALLKLVGDLKSMDDRCEAAGLLARIDYKQVKLEDPAASEPLLKLASDLATEEAKRAKDFQQEEIGQGGVGGGAIGRGAYTPSRSPYGGEYGGGYGGTGDVLQEQERFPRRLVLARLTDLKAGLDAVKPAVPAETQAKFDAILAAIAPVRTQAVNKEVGELAFARSITTMAAAVAAVANPAQAANAADETDPADEFQPVETQEPAALEPMPAQPEPPQTPTVQPESEQPAPPESAPQQPAAQGAGAQQQP